MAGIKILISGTPNSGKTSLLQTLEDVFIVARDGKRYPFQQPHVNITTMVHSKVEGASVVDSLISTTNEKLGVYVEKFGELPKNVVFDSVSKIFLDIESAVAAVVTSFPYGVINTEITKLMNYIEHELVGRGINVIMVSHANWDEDTIMYKLINAGGSWGKKGGVLSEVDNSIFIEAKNNKRIIHHRSLKYIARTLNTTLPDSEPADKYSLKDHIQLLEEDKSKAQSFEL